MHTRLCLLSSALFAALLLNACKGPTGDPGPQGNNGATGATGTIGAAGPKGDPGTPNVVYSDWKSIANWSVSSSGAESYYTMSPVNTANALFTKEAISSAAIFTYVKYRTYVDSVTVNGVQKFKLVERISNDRNVSHYFKVPGRTDATILDYGFSYVYPGGAAENLFSPTIQLNTFTLGTTIPELKNKSAAFVNGLVKDYPQFRHVIVYQGPKGGRLATVNWNNYDEVKEILQLKD